MLLEYFVQSVQKAWNGIYPVHGQGKAQCFGVSRSQPSSFLYRASTSYYQVHTPYSTVSMSILVFPKKCAKPLIDPEGESQESTSYIRRHFRSATGDPRSGEKQGLEEEPGKRDKATRLGHGTLQASALITTPYVLRTLSYLTHPCHPLCDSLSLFPQFRTK